MTAGQKDTLLAALLAEASAQHEAHPRLLLDVLLDGAAGLAWARSICADRLACAKRDVEVYTDLCRALAPDVKE